MSAYLPLVSAFTAAFTTAGRVFHCLLLILFPLSRSVMEEREEWKMEDGANIDYGGHVFS
jgi:hypothetical protein